MTTRDLIRSSALSLSDLGWEGTPENLDLNPVPSLQSSSESTESAPEQELLLERWIKEYGPITYDLCESILWSANTAATLYKQVLQTWKSLSEAKLHYQKHEKAFIFSQVLLQLIPFAEKHGRKLGASEQLMLDANSSPKERLPYLDSYLHRLPPREQALLLLSYKHAFTDEDLSAAFGEPIESLKLHRNQSLESLRIWIWENSL